METTRHWHDRRGRLVRSVTVREPAWTEQDRAEMLALRLYRSWLCPLHGGLLEECTSDEDTGVQFQVDRSTCRAEMALIEAQRAANDGKKPSPYARARLWTVSRRG
ncbi:hypothetical protein [Micromonospora humida]|uniref:hypothetical protein n=1 Tax=Micromonospora humida TaxID=2809018 RepID=UPI00341F0CD2